MERVSYSSGTGSIPLLGETLGANFDRIAATYPSNEAVVSVHQARRYTYRELREATDEFARGLIALGVEHGDRVPEDRRDPRQHQSGVPQFGSVLRTAAERRVRATRADLAQDEQLRGNHARDRGRSTRAAHDRVDR
jgi:non-ribosomal peptide synthetase component F